jgi:hypothetical protein
MAFGLAGFPLSSLKNNVILSIIDGGFLECSGIFTCTGLTGLSVMAGDIVEDGVDFGTASAFLPELPLPLISFLSLSSPGMSIPPLLSH